jgi:hypothetical protein
MDKNFLMVLFLSLFFLNFTLGQVCQTGTNIDFTLTFNGQNSMNEIGNPANETTSICNPAASGYTAYEVSWSNVDVTPIGISWCSEFAIQFGNSSSYSLIFRPAVFEENVAPCDNNYTGGVDLVAEGLTFELDNDGCINFEFYETFDDFPAAVDGNWDSGSLIVKLCNTSVLPVEWLKFEVLDKEIGNLLQWQTATEINVDHFQIQSLDLLSNVWQTIGEVPATGNSIQIQTYNWLDTSPSTQSYYRIASIDVDGEIDYSPVKSLTKSIEGLRINVQGIVYDYIPVHIQTHHLGSNLNLQVYSITGMLIFDTSIQPEDEDFSLEIPLNDSPAGLYILTAENGFEKTSKKVFKSQ